MVYLRRIYYLLAWIGKNKMFVFNQAPKNRGIDRVRGKYNLQTDNMNENIVHARVMIIYIYIFIYKSIIL